jgi:hypothetical protein
MTRSPPSDHGLAVSSGALVVWVCGNALYGTGRSERRVTSLQKRKGGSSSLGSGLTDVVSLPAPSPAKLHVYSTLTKQLITLVVAEKDYRTRSSEPPTQQPRKPFSRLHLHNINTTPSPHDQPTDRSNQPPSCPPSASSRLVAPPLLSSSAPRSRRR